jgi:hypothetical protein
LHIARFQIKLPLTVSQIDTARDALPRHRTLAAYPSSSTKQSQLVFHDFGQMPLAPPRAFDFAALSIKSAFDQFAFSSLAARIATQRLRATQAICGFQPGGTAIAALCASAAAISLQATERTQSVHQASTREKI